MTRVVNIVIVGLLYLGGYFFAKWILDTATSNVLEGLNKSLWGLGALIIGTLGQLVWKVHDAKRVEGLNVQQRRKLRRISKLISLRLYIVMAISLAASVIAFLANVVTETHVARFMSDAALGAILASGVLWLIWIPLTQWDLQRFEDRARESTLRSSDATKLLERLKGST